MMQPYHTHLPTIHDPNNYWQAVVGLELAMMFYTFAFAREVMEAMFRRAGYTGVAQVVRPQCLVFEVKGRV